jgi:lipid II:glycine glycyltransferase (peptidoglycan interpeptide bridge formation enzyme)
MLLKSDDFFINLIKNNRTILANVIHNNKCVAAVTFIIGGKTVYAHMSGSDSEANKTTGAGTYYYWKAIEYFKELGYDQFDFGGCPLNPIQEDPAYGIFMFKQGFGGDYQEFSCGKIIIAPLSYKLLQFLLSQRKLLRLFSKNL